MKSGTLALHDRLAVLGRSLGFDVEHEVSNSLLAIRLDRAYKPRIDLMWSLPLREQQCAALAWALGHDLTGVTHLPVVGIEVEGTTPSTKTMESDLANLTALGAPLAACESRNDKELSMRRYRAPGGEAACQFGVARTDDRPWSTSSVSVPDAVSGRRQGWAR